MKQEPGNSRPQRRNFPERSGQPGRRIPGTRRLAGAVLGLLLSATAAAQDLNAYRGVTGGLEAALRDRPAQPLTALKDVDAATTAFEKLAPTLQSSVVVDGTRVAIKNARIAVGRSQADLEAQVTQVRGLLRRGLSEQLLSDLTHASSQGLTLLGTEFGLAEAERSELLRAASAGNADLVVALLERAAAGKLNAALQGADPARPTAAYLEMARALSWFTVVQDSPRVAGLRGEDFSDALAQITRQDRAAFTSARTSLLNRTGRFEAAAHQAVTAARARQPLPQVTDPAPAVTPSASGNTPSPSARPTPAQSGTSLDSLLQSALAQAGHGDVRGAQASLDTAARALDSLPAKMQAAPGFGAFADGLRGAARLPFLRPADLRAQIGAYQNLRAESEGQPQSLLDRASASVQSVWGGWLSGAMWVVLGLLAVVPLYLLNLAFGGRNPYWRAIGVSFGLLLAPAMLEGLASLGAWIGNVTGFGALSNFSLLQSPLSGLLWALSVALAVGLGIYGFRGLCVQFGLLKGSAASPRATQIAQSTVEWDEEV